jgi:hypothetical protein
MPWSLGPVVGLVAPIIASHHFQNAPRQLKAEFYCSSQKEISNEGLTEVEDLSGHCFASGAGLPRVLTVSQCLCVCHRLEQSARSGGTTSTIGLCEQVIPPVGPYLNGPTARVSKINRRGTRTTVVDGLPSGLNSVGDIQGVADVTFIGHKLYLLLAGGGCSHGSAKANAAVLRVNADGSTTAVANLSAFQKGHPVKNPFAGDFEPDGSWYSMISIGDLLFADISASQGHIVPTSVAFHRGNFYVGNLGLFPITAGSSKILKISPFGHVTTFATGFTTVLGVTFDRKGRLYVLETTTGDNPFPTPGTGRVLRVGRYGKIEEIATGLFLPTAMTFGPDGNLYVSNVGFGPPPIGLGQVVKITLPNGDSDSD